VGGGPHRCRDDRGLVRRCVGANHGAAAWSVEASDRLSARDRLAGA
jgi:hypothetical protein